MLTVGGTQAEVQAAEKRVHGPQVPMCMPEPEMCPSGGERSSDHVAKYGPHLPFQIKLYWHTAMPPRLNNIYCIFGIVMAEIDGDSVVCRTGRMSDLVLSRRKRGEGEDGSRRPSLLKEGDIQSTVCWGEKEKKQKVGEG